MNKQRIQTAIGVIAITLFSGQVRGNTAADIGTLPSQKVPAPIDPGDRNPFTTRIDNPGPKKLDTDSEEGKIRQIFASLKVTGRAPASQGGPRVLLGDLILKEGGMVPQVIENQTDVLRVTRITDKEIELTWVNEQDVDVPRKLLIPISLEPGISYLLPGRSSATDGGQFVTMEAKRDAAAKTGDGSGNSLAEIYPDDEGAPVGGGASKEETPAEPERVSPFGLFRR